MKNYILLQYSFIIFIILVILRQLLVVPWKQFFAIFCESRNQTYDLFPIRQRYDGDGILDALFVVIHGSLNVWKQLHTTECLRDVTLVGDYVCTFVRLGSLNFCKALSQLNVTFGVLVNYVRFEFFVDEYSDIVITICMSKGQLSVLIHNVESSWKHITWRMCT